MVKKLRLALTALAAGAAHAAPNLADLLETLRQNPNSPAVHNNVGLALKQNGENDAAMKHFAQATMLDAGYARGYQNLGNALQAQYRADGDVATMEGAVEQHAMAIRLAPTMASAYSSLGNALRALQRPEDAVGALTVAVKLSGTAQTYSNLGAASLALHHLRSKEATRSALDGSGAQATEQAAAALQAALRWLRLAEQLAPADPTTANNLAAALEADGQLGGARALFERALAATPQSALLQIHRANVLKGQGALHEAVYAYHAALALPQGGGGAAGAPLGLAYNNLGAALQALGSSHLALQAYSTAIELEPHDEVARANLHKLPVGPAYRRMADYEVRVLRVRAAAAVLAARGARRRGHEALAELPRPGAPLLSALYYRAIRYLRRLETERAPPPAALLDGGGGGGGGGGALWGGRAEDMARRLEEERSGAGSTRRQLTLGAFAWGGVWLHSFAAALTHAEVRAALLRARRDGGTAVVLGSSLGFEAYLPALTYGVRTVGVELLCGLQQLAEAARAVLGVPRELASFECADALSWALPPDTALVYVDDTAWDAHMVELLAAKLAAELPAGAVVVHNAQSGYVGQRRLRLLEAKEVACSWDAHHPVLVRMTHGAPPKR